MCTRSQLQQTALVYMYVGHTYKCLQQIAGTYCRFSMSREHFVIAHPTPANVQWVQILRRSCLLFVEGSMGVRDWVLQCWRRVKGCVGGIVNPRFVKGRKGLGCYCFDLNSKYVSPRIIYSIMSLILILLLQGLNFLYNSVEEISINSFIQKCPCSILCVNDMFSNNLKNPEEGLAIRASTIPLYF